MYQNMGNKEKAIQKLKQCEELEKEVAEAETALSNLKNSSATSSVEVDNFLKRGRAVMGIGASGANKEKKKRSDKSNGEEKQDDGEEKQEEGNQDDREEQEEQEEQEEEKHVEDDC